MNPRPPLDFYAILGVGRASTKDEIKDRFRQLARERHPDRFRGEEKARAETEFQAIAEAFNILSDPIRRRQHDLELDQPKRKPEHDPTELLRVYLNRGIRAYKAGNYLEAANNFVQATDTQPGSGQAWHHLAMASMQEKRWLPKAQEAIERACALEPRNVAFLKLAGKIFVSSGLTAKAKQYYNQASSLGDMTARKALAELEGAAGGAVERRSGGAGSGSNPGRDEAKPGIFRKFW